MGDIAFNNGAISPFAHSSKISIWDCCYDYILILSERSMINYIQILNTVLPVIIILAIGMICRKKSMLSHEGIGALKSVVVNITLPTVMLGAFAAMTYSWKNIVVTLLMFFVCIAAWLLGFVLKNIFRMKSRFVPFLTTGFEAGMLGYALFSLLYGSENISAFAAVDLGQVLFVFTLYKVFIGIDSKAEGSKPKASVILKEMFSSPVVIAIIVGVLIGATGLYKSLEAAGFNVVFDSCVDFVSAPTSAIILLTIGYDIVFEKLPWGKILSVTVSRIAIMALLRVLAGLAVRAIGMGDSLDAALNVMLILPPPYVLPVFADDEDERGYVSLSLSFMTMLTIAGFIVLAVLM